MAHMRYTVWGAQAAKDGFPNVARLFKAVSRAEIVHGSSHFRELRETGGAFPVTAMAGFGIGSTAENLAGAIEGETFEINEMYPAYLSVATTQQEKGALRSFTYAWETEKIHAGMYTKARASVLAGKDMQLGPVHVCSVCGYTVEGAVPDKCPLCNALKDKFESFA